MRFAGFRRGPISTRRTIWKPAHRGVKSHVGRLAEPVSSRSRKAEVESTFRAVALTQQLAPHALRAIARARYRVRVGQFGIRGDGGRGIRSVNARRSADLRAERRRARSVRCDGKRWTGHGPVRNISRRTARPIPTSPFGQAPRQEIAQLMWLRMSASRSRSPTSAAGNNARQLVGSSDKGSSPPGWTTSAAAIAALVT